MNSSLLLFNNDVKHLIHIFKRNQCLENLINRVIKAFPDNNVNSAPSDEIDTLYPGGGGNFNRQVTGGAILMCEVMP